MRDQVSASALSDRYFFRALSGHAIAAVLLVVVGRFSDLDLHLADWMYDASLRQFPWRDNWFLAVLLHHWLKSLLFGFGVLLIAALVADRLGSRRLWAPLTRWRLQVVVASLVLVPVSVSLLKRSSMHSCPWDLERYGGTVPYLRIFDALPAGVQPGHCFPAGHASSALWLASFAVFLLPQRPRMAALWFAAGLIPGLALGWIQQVRGAHFLTHTLWSAWIASFLILLLVRLVRLP